MHLTHLSAEPPAPYTADPPAGLQLKTRKRQKSDSRAFSGNLVVPLAGDAPSPSGSGVDGQKRKALTVTAIDTDLAGLQLAGDGPQVGIRRRKAGFLRRRGRTPPGPAQGEDGCSAMTAAHVVTIATHAAKLATHRAMVATHRAMVRGLRKRRCHAPGDGCRARGDDCRARGEGCHARGDGRHASGYACNGPGDARNVRSADPRRPAEEATAAMQCEPWRASFPGSMASPHSTTFLLVRLLVLPLFQSHRIGYRLFSIRCARAGLLLQQRSEGAVKNAALVIVMMQLR
ncbi:MAG TPA: hypothetical protein VIT91_13420, partial [Chthoniobacterales bacterium]